MFWNDRQKLKKHGLLLDHAIDDDGRCRECGGACCRSFPSVPLTFEEYQRLTVLGSGRLHFSLTGRHLLIIENGCEFLSDGHCSIYEHRPDVCRRFFCSD
ncbi:YkgJ family cysteine cluster protein [Geomesophilobacter sediminis]|uniref:YkgJ family cysteine cluster protein n=1 Tax=Geomesophilobacter sediminis TaxID=2798584 RepID=A0A8J7LYU4_9BACT|nr:YkgJ family cysteine cluster protein [Geomesophilobacter sediminis]MBJ6725566.1 YkgJ family cysteine cluster protein [Geomesophilobacter sediminis]